MLPAFSAPNADPDTDVPEPRAVWANRVSPEWIMLQFGKCQKHILHELPAVWSREILKCICLGIERKRTLPAQKTVCALRIHVSRFF